MAYLREISWKVPVTPQVHTRDTRFTLLLMAVHVLRGLNTLAIFTACLQSFKQSLGIQNEMAIGVTPCRYLPPPKYKRKKRFGRTLILFLSLCITCSSERLNVQTIVAPALEPEIDLQYQLN